MAFWRRKKRRNEEEAADDASEPLATRVRRLEADIDDLYDRLGRLAGRHARRAQRDAADDEAAAPVKPNGKLPSIAELRAQGRLPWR